MYASQVVFAWFEIIRDGYPSAAILDHLLANAQQLLPNLASPWPRVRDPVQVMHLLAEQLDWVLNGTSTVEDDLGRVMGCKRTSPIVAAKLAKLSAQRWSDLKALSRGEAQQIDGAEASSSQCGWVAPIFWAPLLPLLHRQGPHWTAGRRASLKAITSNSVWPQARMMEHGRASHYRCLICASRGTLWHRHYECDVHKEDRKQAISEQLARSAARAAGHREKHAELFARAIFPDPSQLVPWQSHSPQDEVRWIDGKRPPGDRLTGMLFLDGSGLFPHSEMLRRAGWSIVQVDRFGELMFGAFGPVPLSECPLQTSRDGEDYAAFMLSNIAMAPLEWCVDCEGTVDCLKHQTLGISSRSYNSHLRVAFWAQFLPGDFACHKTLAHATATDVEGGRSTTWEKKANNTADKFAKLGAAIHGYDAEGVEVIKVRHSIASQAALWAGELGSHLSSNSIRDAEDFAGTYQLFVCDEPPGGIWHQPADHSDGSSGVDCDSWSCLYCHATNSGSLSHCVACGKPYCDSENHHVVAANVPYHFNKHVTVVSEFANSEYGDLFFCMSCGASAWKQFGKSGLHDVCKGPADISKRRQRFRLANMLYPGNSFIVGNGRIQEPKPLDTITRNVLADRLGPEDSIRVVGEADPVLKHSRALSRTSFSRESLLACFGLDDYSCKELVEWGLSLRVKVIKSQEACALDELEAFEVDW